MRIIYEFMQQPKFWVVHDDDGYWLVPVRHGGWHEREPFIGRVTHLQIVEDVQGLALGWD
jgi:hypothetical protein